MSKPVLMAEVRNKKKKRNLKTLRKEGYVPGVVYGHNTENKNLKFKKNEIERVLNRCEVGSSVELKINGEKTLAIIKDIQNHITKDEVLHIDLQQLTAGEKVRVKIPIHIINKSTVESSAFVVQEQLNEIELQTIPKYLPQHIDVDASLLKSVDVIKVGDLDIYKDENIEILSDPEQIVALLTTASKQEAAVTEEQEENLTDLY